MSAYSFANFSLVALTSSSAAYIPGSFAAGAAGGSFAMTASAASASDFSSGFCSDTCSAKFSG
jgi:hypothetical protein